MNRKELLIISVAIFLTIISWVVIDIYNIKTKVVLESQIKSTKVRDYDLDRKITDVLKQKSP